MLNNIAENTYMINDNRVFRMANVFVEIWSLNFSQNILKQANIHILKTVIYM